jgi:glycine hydroxymethyltransferase
MLSFDKIKNIISENKTWRDNCVNLIASENIMLPEVEPFYSNSFMHRYAEGKPFDRYYNGTKYIDEIEQNCQDYFKNKFNVGICDTRPISGAIANLSVFSAMRKNGKVITNSLPSGGHITHNKVGTLGRILNYEIKNFPQNKENPFVSDIDETKKLITEFNPDFIVFGKSMFLFPEPIKEIRDEFPDLTIIYDSAHVFGLVYQGEFQKPFEEGADILTASTHKTFPGPQGGIILSKTHNEFDKFMFPGVVSNHHLHRLPTLLMTAIMMDEKYPNYAKNVVENAKYFAEELYSQGFDVCCEKFGFTKSHQVILDVTKQGGRSFVANELEKNNIIVNKNSLPWDKSVINPSGIRIGVQEMTLRGKSKSDFKELAENFKKILIDKL